MHAYDPDRAPDSTAWLQLDEGERLVASGMTRHAAVHAIGMIVAEELSAMLKAHRRFDEAGFVRRLRALTRESYERGG